MQVFKRYLEKHSLYDSLISSLPSPSLNLSVVIPCFNEPDLLKSLESLMKCKPTRKPVEVIIVINQPVNISKKISDTNEQTCLSALNWAKVNSSEIRMYHIINMHSLPEKDAGVGLARKIGMDEAVRRFEIAGNSNGVIVGFDADCTCSDNYLTEIEKVFENKDINGASVYFEHPFSGNEFSEDIYKLAWQYELHLRYYKNSLKWAGFPFAFHTIGSSFAVRADVYCKQGGMNKKKAGEDFYFLSKVIPLGKYIEINDTVVYPSSRPSDRVPFGTGAAILKTLTSNIRLFETYPFELFVYLKNFFEETEKMYNDREFVFPQNVLGEYCISVNFKEDLDEIRSNCSSLKSFNKRFFTVFNAFRILKYLNFAENKGFVHKPVEIESYKLLNTLGIESNDIMNSFRKIDRQ